MINKYFINTSTYRTNILKILDTSVIEILQLHPQRILQYKKNVFKKNLILNLIHL